MESFVNLMDVCYKAFFALNLHYPEDGNDCWQIVQTIVYEVKTKYDKCSKGADTFINDVKVEISNVRIM